MTGARRARPAPRSHRAARDRPSVDTDGDGLPDAWERLYGLDPDDAADAAADSDGDGLDNLTELRHPHALNGVDSDRDGVNDGDEDSDGDGLRNGGEIEAGLEPVGTPTRTTTASTTARTTPTATARRTSPSSRRAPTPARATRSRPSPTTEDPAPR